MYEEHFGFREPPFRITPDPRFLYRNPCVEEAAAALAYGIERRKGFISLVGEAGTGKTTLLRHVLDSLSGNVRTVVLLHPTVEFDEILEYVLAELGIPVDGGRKLVLLQRLHEFLVEHTRGGGNVALLVDEAQDLATHVLEELRLLSNLETGTEKILQIVLAGQPELETKLADHALRQLRQRIALHVRLRPLSPEEVEAYIRTRLELAGAKRNDVFTPAATSRIALVSRGIPRIVNVLCDACLVTAYAVNAPRVTPDIVDEAWTDYSRLVGDLPEALPTPPRLAPGGTPPRATVAPRAQEAQPAVSEPAAAASATTATAAPPAETASEPAATATAAAAATPPTPSAAPTPPPPRQPAAAARPRPAPIPPTAAPRGSLPEVTPSTLPLGIAPDEPAPAERRSPWWNAPRVVSVVAVVAIVGMLAFNYSLRHGAPTRDAMPAPETAVAHMPVVSADADPRVTPASPEEARALVHAYLLAYEARDAARLAALFAPDAVANDDVGETAIRTAYQRTFEQVRDVSMTVPRITTVANGERLTISGPVVIAYRDADGGRTELRGSAEWEIAREDGVPRILRVRQDATPSAS